MDHDFLSLSFLPVPYALFTFLTSPNIELPFQESSLPVLEISFLKGRNNL